MSLTGTPAPVVEVRDLSKRYRRRDPLAADSVSFAIEPGQALGLLGPKGPASSRSSGWLRA